MKTSPFNNKLPNNWEWVILDDVLIEKPCNGLYKSADFIGRGTLFLDINGLYKGLTADFSQARRVEVTENEYRQYELVKGDILFNRVSKMPEGVGKAVVVGELQEPAVYESNMIRVRLNNQRVDSLFVVNYLSTNQSRRELLSKANISNQASINQQAIKSLAIPLPPTLTEQRRIMAILDRAEELRSKRREAIAQLDTLTQAIFLEMFGDPVTNPKGWTVSKLGDIAEKITDGEHQTPKRTLQGIKLLSARNVQNGYIDVRDVDYVSIEEYERIMKRCNPVRGDILLSCSGTIGRVTTVDTDEPFSLVRSVALLKLKHDLINSKFLEYFLRTPALHAKMQQRANASSQANLFQNQIRELPAFIPPLTLQKEFSHRVEAVEKLKAAHRASLSELDALFASLQHRAFRGEL